jgi:uncharacterized protein DUF6883
MSAETTTPAVGKALPRARDAHMTPDKLNWILAEHGHGPEWARVFCVTAEDSDRLWAAIAEAVLDAHVVRVINKGEHGIVCGVSFALTLDDRTATVSTAWHYATAGAAPRLVTAYPTL